MNEAYAVTETPRAASLTRRLLDWAWPGHPKTWRGVPRRAAPVLLRILRLTSAGVLAYLVTDLVTTGPVDLTCALTALLVVQASAYRTLRMAFVRIGAVLLGVLVAVVLSIWVGLTWWSLAAAIFLALLGAHVFRLHEQAMETAISAMLILGVVSTSAETAAETRFFTTLIGAAVGFLMHLAFPPIVPNLEATRAVQRVADASADVLESVASDVAAHPVTRVTARSWLDAGRTVSRATDRASELVDEVRERRRLNRRAWRTENIEPILRAGLDTLETSSAAVRTLLRVVWQEAPERETPDDGFGEQVRPVFATVLEHMAGCFRAYGAFVHAEAMRDDVDAEESLARSLDLLRESRAALTELLLVDAHTETDLWLLRGSILTGINQVLEELDIESLERSRHPAEEPARLPAIRLLDQVLDRREVGAAQERNARPQAPGTPAD